MDKDAVIEVREDRSDGIVLGRKSLATIGGPVLPLSNGPAIEVAVGAASTTLDDYLTWSPGLVIVRQTSGTTPLAVEIRNMPAATNHLLFAANQNPWPVGTTATSSMISTTVPASGNSLTVVAAGSFGSPSSRDKDAVIEVVNQATGRILVREGLMVRVRKNANTLTALERTAFLRALGRLNYQADAYDQMQKTHHNGLDEAHGLPAFLPWHRVFMLEYERMLQAMDPGVSLHYWRFDQPAPNVFSTTFMGNTITGSDVTFDASNPLSLWRVEDDNTPPGVITGIRRKPAYPPTSQPALSDETTTLGMGSPGGLTATYQSFLDMEGDPHGNAHVETGGLNCNFFGCTCIGVICDVRISVRDPLFFLLHSNVDRLWAKWQWIEARFDGTMTEAYVPQSDPGTGSCDGHRSYIDGKMWPWSGVTNATDPCRPSIAAGGVLVVTVVSPTSPPSQPKPRDVIDFRFAALNMQGNGFAYDDIPHP